MKKIFLFSLLIPVLTFAQFKSESDKKVNLLSGITNNNPSSFLTSFFNPENFSMKHSVSMSYSSFAGQGIAMGVYTNNMSYKISDKMNVEADISLVNSPYSSLGNNFSKEINGIYLSRAQFNYQPTENFFITLQYNSLPYYSPFLNNGFGFFSGFERGFGY
ncbi:MAG: hypothetical protein Fur0015_05480 [Ignavibacteriales bacterium]